MANESADSGGRSRQGPGGVEPPHGAFWPYWPIPRTPAVLLVAVTYLGLPLATIAITVMQRRGMLPGDGTVRPMGFGVLAMSYAQLVSAANLVFAEDRVPRTAVGRQRVGAIGVGLFVIALATSDYGDWLVRPGSAPAGVLSLFRFHLIGVAGGLGLIGLVFRAWWRARGATVRDSASSEE